jgi:hypothetical protein
VSPEAVPLAPQVPVAVRAVPRDAASSGERPQVHRVARRVAAGTAHPVAADSWCRVGALPAVACALVARAAGAVHPVSSAAAWAAVAPVGQVTRDAQSLALLLRDADSSDEPEVP